MTPRTTVLPLVGTKAEAVRAPPAPLASAARAWALSTLYRRPLHSGYCAILSGGAGLGRGRWAGSEPLALHLLRCTRIERAGSSADSSSPAVACSLDACSLPDRDGSAAAHRASFGLVPLRNALEHRGVQGILAREVVVEARDADSDPGRDLAQGGAFEAALGEDLFGDVEDLLGRAPSLLASAADRGCTGLGGRLGGRRVQGSLQKTN